mmetsp:Transcript_5081/g.15214  ORF Transcript_5081/g.15214 Transcript_5081/m.15214 type:complete len:174 (-) Transcript_5081:111-632(-)
MNERQNDLEPEQADIRLRDVTMAATWSVSSAKVGNGVLQLLDGDATTCWQSDGSTPHIIYATFPHRVLVKEVQILVNHEADESYTPAKVRLRVYTGLEGINIGDVVELNQPRGWIGLPIDFVVGVFTIQIGIFANHQNGRDTHVRGVRVLACSSQCHAPRFHTVEYSSAATIR